MAALDVTKKLHVYHILYRLNLSFSNIVHQCRALQETGSFAAKSSKLFQGYAQELQAEINQENELMPSLSIDFRTSKSPATTASRPSGSIQPRRAW